MRKSYSWVLAATAAIVPVIAVLSARGLAPVFIIATLAALFLFYREENEWPPVNGAIATILGALIAWSAVTALWSPLSVTALITTGKIAFLSLLGLAFVGIGARTPEGDRTTIRRFLIGGFVLSIAMMASEIATNGFISNSLRYLFAGGAENDTLIALNMSACVAAILIWPVIAALRSKGTVAILILAVGATTATLLGLESLAAIVAVLVGAVAFIASRYAPLTINRIVQVCVVVGVLFAPVIPNGLPSPSVAIDIKPSLSFSIIHRISIWQFAAERIREKPAQGWGMDSSRAFQARFAPDFPKKFIDANTDERKPAALAYFKSQLLPLHPHNGVLQIWLELGAVGAMLVLSFALLTIRASVRRISANFDLSACSATMVSAGTIACTTFGIWQSWWISALWLIATLMLTVIEKPSEGKP